MKSKKDKNKAEATTSSTEEVKADKLAAKEVSKFITTLRGLGKRLDKLTIDADSAVKRSVELLWAYGDIEVINQTMNTLKIMKGIDNRALCTYYRQCVPYSYDQAAECFTKISRKHVEKMQDTWKQFIEETKWHDFSKVKQSKEYVFDVSAVVKLVVSRLDKADKTGQITPEKLDQLAQGLNQALNSRAVDQGVDEQIRQVEEAIIADSPALLLKGVG